jgi:hypothetical protein
MAFVYGGVQDMFQETLVSQDDCSKREVWVGMVAHVCNSSSQQDCDF